MKALAFRLRPRLKVGLAPQVIILLLVLALAGAMAVTPVRQLVAQRERINGMTQELHAVERSNQRLKARMERLNNPDFLEQQARQIGLIRPGEKAIVVVPPSKKATQKHQGGAAKKDEAPAPPGFVEGLLAFIGIS